MDLSQITTAVSTQVLVMLVLIILGYVLTKRSLLTNKGVEEMTTILVNIVTPCVLIRAYHIPFDKKQVYNLLIGYGVCFAVHFVYFIIARFYFISEKDKSRALINQASGAYSNCGFMGIPLLEACLGSMGTFYGSTYLGVFNILIWSHLLCKFKPGEEKFKFSKLINPGIVGVLIGLVFYFTQFKLPVFAYDSISFMANLNTPIAMIVIGNMLAKSKLREVLKMPDIYSVSVFKLILAPLLLAFILRILDLDTTMSIAIVICSACPSAAIVPIFARKYKLDYEYSAKLTVSTTVFSLITIPVVCYLTTLIL